MKAISLHHPHAEAVRLGLKQNETRGKRTHLRGDIAICSTRSLIGSDKTWDRKFLKEAAERLGGKDALDFGDFIDGLPHGFVLAVVEIHDCVPTENFMRGADRAMLPLRVLSEDEHFWGNYGPGRFVWLLRNLRPLRQPVRVIGRQFIFDLPADVEAKVKEQL